MHRNISNGLKKKKTHVLVCGDRGLKNCSVDFTSQSIVQSLNNYCSVFDSSFNLVIPEKKISSIIKFVFNYIKKYFSETPALIKKNPNHVILITNSVSLGYKIISSLIKKRKAAIIVHDTLFATMYKDEFSKSILLKSFLYLTNTCFWQKTLHRYSLLLAVSKKTKNDLIKEGFNKDIIKVVPNGVSEIFFKPLKISEPLFRDPYIFIFSSDQQRKNLYNSFKAFNILKKKYPNFKLVKSGQGVMNSERQRTIDEIQSINPALIKDIIFINEFLDVEKLKNYYYHSQLFLYPSLSEGFGLTILEGQAVGTPVITSNLSPMKELVPYKELLVDPLSPEDIAKKCLKILESKNLRSRIVKEGKENAKKHSWDNSARILYDHLSNLEA